MVLTNLVKRLVVYGEMEAGKTCLLTRFYGMEHDGFWLNAMDAGQRSWLRTAFDSLKPGEQNIDKTDQSELYRFAFRVDGVSQKAFELHWLDYPGEWWTETEGVDDPVARQQMLDYVLQCDAGILLIDGKKLLANPNVGHQTIHQFLGELIEQREAAEKTGVRVTLPKFWIICMTKADLIDKRFTARQFYEDFLSTAKAEKAIDNVRALCDTSEFGGHFLLLSSVKANAKGIIDDPYQSFGLDLIAPIIYADWVRDMRHRLERAGERQPDWLVRIGEFFGFDSAKIRAAKVREESKMRQTEGHIADAALLQMRARLLDDDAKRLYYKR